MTEEASGKPCQRRAKSSLMSWLSASERKVQRTTGADYTHLCLNGGKFVVPKDQYSSFISNLSKDLSNGLALHLVEKLAEAAPICIDIDIGGEGAKPKKRAVLQLVKVVVQALQEAVQHLVEPAHLSDNSLNVVVLLKPGAREISKPCASGCTSLSWKDGVHLMMPGVRLGWEARSQIRDRMLANSRLASEYDAIKQTHSLKQDLGAALDEVYFRKKSNSWLVYGCNKPLKQGEEPSAPYVVRYEVTGDGQWRKDGKDGVEPHDNWAYWAARLSVLFPTSDVCATLRGREQGHITEMQTNDHPGRHALRLDCHAEQATKAGYEARTAPTTSADAREVEQARQLVPHLADWRATQYKAWRDVAFVLSYISHTLLPTFLAFSKRDPSKFDNAACVELWHKAPGSRPANPLTMGSLIVWARQDTEGTPGSQLVEQIVRSKPSSHGRTTQHPCGAGESDRHEAPRGAQACRFFVSVQCPQPATPAMCASYADKAIRKCLSKLGLHSYLQSNSSFHWYGALEDHELLTCAMVALDFRVRNLAELQAFTDELHKYLIENRRAYPLFFPIDLPTSLKGRDSVWPLHMPESVNPANMGLQPLNSTLSLHDLWQQDVAQLPLLDLQKAQQLSIWATPLHDRPPAEELDADELGDLSSRLNSWASTLHHFPDAVELTFASRQCDDRILARCAISTSCPYSRLERAETSSADASTPRCNVRLQFDAAQSSAELCCTCRAFDIKSFAIGPVVLDSGDMSCLARSFGTVHGASMHAQRQDIQWAEEYDEEHMRPLPNKRLLAVVANMGTGKTEAMHTKIRQVLADKPDARIIFVTANVLLCGEIHAKLKGDGFVLYSDVKSCEITHPLAIVCINSLRRIATHEGPASFGHLPLGERIHIDMLVLDELKSIIDACNSKFMANEAGQVLARLQSLACNCQQVVAIDAFLDTMAPRILIDSLGAYMRETAYWIRNAHVRQPALETERVEVTVHHTGEITEAGEYRPLDESRGATSTLRCAAIDLLLQYVQQGSATVFMANDRSTVDSAKAALDRWQKQGGRHLRIGIYTADEKHVDGDGQMQGSDAWKHLDVLLYSPTLVAGISFTDLHFDHKIAVFRNTRGAPGAFTCMQMLHRVRCTSSQRINLFLEARRTLNTHLPLTWPRVVEFLDTALIHATARFWAADMHLHHLLQVNVQHGTGISEYRKDLLSYKLIVALMLDGNQDATYFAQRILSCFRDDYCYNIKLHQLELEHDKKVPKRDNEGVPFAQVRRLREEAYHRMRRSPNLSNEDRASVAMHGLQKAYGIPELRWPQHQHLCEGNTQDAPKAEDFYTNAVDTKHPWRQLEQYERLQAAQEAGECSSHFVAAVRKQLQHRLDSADGDANFCKNKRSYNQDSNLLIYGLELLHALAGASQVRALGRGQAIDKTEADIVQCAQAMMRRKQHAEAAELRALLGLREGEAVALTSARKLLRDAFSLQTKRKSTNNQRSNNAVLSIQANEKCSFDGKFRPTYPKAVRI